MQDLLQEIEAIVSSTQSLAVVFALLVLSYVFYAGSSARMGQSSSQTHPF